MRFSNVSIAAVAHVDAPIRVTSDELEAPLAATYARLGMPARLIEPLTGVRARRWWNPGMQPSDGAALAGEKLFSDSGLDRARVGVLVNTSVCRDWVEPSTACFVHHKLALSEDCINFDVANACLGFLDGMQIVANLIERGEVDYGLVVDAESSRHVVEQTVARLSQPSCDAAMVKEQLATLTVGSGAAAMLLARSDLAPGGHRFLGAVSTAATQYNQLCRGQLDFGLTDTKSLLQHGVAIAQRTWERAQKTFGWTADSVDHFAMHQVSELHTQTLSSTLGFPLDKAFLVYPELGNVGPASVPMVLSKASCAERYAPGDRVILAGIGSGLNCTAAAVLW
ncbi:MAG: 3-oxoacyl-ACP synthase III [Polyangia bacterium]